MTSIVWLNYARRAEISRLIPYLMLNYSLSDVRRRSPRERIIVIYNSSRCVSLKCVYVYFLLFNALQNENEKNKIIPACAKFVKISRGKTLSFVLCLNPTYKKHLIRNENRSTSLVRLVRKVRSFPLRWPIPANEKNVDRDGDYPIIMRLNEGPDRAWGDIIRAIAKRQNGGGW